MQLDDLVLSLDVREKLQRAGRKAQKFFTPLAAAAALYADVAAGYAVEPERQSFYTQQVVESYQLPKTDYGLEGKIYVHIPSWVKVSKVPLHRTGPNLFGYTFPSTGYAFVREDLFDNHETGELHETEVTLHEVLHNLYPNASEGEVRAHVRSILGWRASIHARLG